MACPKCGCRMVSKVGGKRSGRLLICTDCGWPVDLSSLAREQGRRWRAALLLGLLALGGLLLFLLGSLNEGMQEGGDGMEEGGPARQEEAPAGGEATARPEP